jgi:hypothetical protein
MYGMSDMSDMSEMYGMAVQSMAWHIWNGIAEYGMA